MNEINLQKAMRIYYFLLKEGELTFDNNKELYLDYSDSEVRDILEILAKESNVLIEKYNQVVYLIPNEDNDVLGIKDMDLQKVLSYDARKIDFYLSQYIIIVIITVFYSGKGSFVKSRDFIRVGELEEIITSRLEYANSKKDIESEQQEAAFNITGMYEHWSALQIDEEGKRKTKYGYIRSVCTFLAKHGLLIFDTVEEDIRPSAKFTNFMTYNFLDNSRLEIIEEILG
ncbi:DUF6063 family protein [Herbivorax sp. ANBcel31]|uniref:DUF6063 family protein n=1 Tax=Herbivorax sp. ANBcel31 TaxID=3069754 RepID=UPI0027B0F967|nr:DUF6063 family protein [Herbivorax sp. ANBcel31]MDQ2085063.1 DUF6063 family protein [Herbivorax sp. ANBcel31]